MKVLLVNGSPHKNGCTYTALCEVSSALNENGISSVCSLSNLFFRFHTTTLTEACSNELKQHHL